MGDSVLGGISDEGTEQHVVGGQQPQELGDILCLGEVGAVEVGVFIRELVEQPGVGSLDVVGGHAGRVGGHKHVGHDAATAIDGASGHGGEYILVIELDGIGVEDLAAGISVDDFLVVAVVVATGVVLLYAASRGGVIALDGEAYLGGVGQYDRALDKSLAERTAPENEATVVVLNGAGDDFRRRCGEFVDKHHEGLLGEAAGAVGEPVGVLAWIAALYFHDGAHRLEELVGHEYGLVDEAAGVSAQVEDIAFGTTGAEGNHRLKEFAKRVGGELIDSNVSDVVVNNIGCVDGN